MLRYLPSFERDLAETINHITNKLENPSAAKRLTNDVETAITKRLDHPLSFAPYPTIRVRKVPYHRIYVGNYTIFYVVIGDVMEVRRFMYSAMDIDRRLEN